MTSTSGHAPNGEPGPPPDARRAEIERARWNLTSRNPRFRADAARRLGQLRAEPQALLEALADPNSYVRAAAAEALGYAAGEAYDDVVDGLLATLDDPNDYVCAAAIRALGLLDAELAADQIRPFLDDDEPAVVQAALEALGRLGPPEAAPEIATFLDSPSYGVQLAATRAVGQLDYTPAGPQVLANLEAVLRRPGPRDFKQLRTYIGTLARLQVKAAVPVLTTIAQEEVGLRSIAVRALIDLGAETAAPLLAQMLADPSSTLRRTLIKMMVQADYRPALPLIRPLLQDPAVPIRQAALAAVRHWHDPLAGEQVRRMAYHDPNPFVRPRAVETLVDLLGAEALPDLEALAPDQNAAVRLAVAHGFQKLGRPMPVAAGGGAPGPALPPAAGEAAANPVPAPIVADGAALRARLERWQALLPARAADAGSAESAEIRAALRTLIAALEQAGAVAEADRD